MAAPAGRPGRTIRYVRLCGLSCVSATTRRCSSSQASGLAEPSHPGSAARPHRETRSGDLGRVPPPRGRGADDVRTDDRRGRILAPRSPGGPGTDHVALRGLSGRPTSPGPARSSSRGVGGMGGAQPLAATLAGAAILCIDVDQRSIARRLETRYRAGRVARGCARSRASRRERAAAVVRGVSSRTRSPELVARGEAFDLVTDQTAAHDPLTGYAPAQVPFEEAAALREHDPDAVLRCVRVDRGARPRNNSGSSGRRYVFDYGNNLRRPSSRPERRLCISGLRPGVFSAAVLSGDWTVQVAALSGDPADSSRGSTVSSR